MCFKYFLKSQHAAGTAVSLSPEPLEKCIKCFQDFPLSQLITHSASCTGAILGDNNERFKDFVPSVYDVSGVANLSVTWAF